MAINRYIMKSLRIRFIWISILVAALLISCSPTHRELSQRAAELCGYIPDVECLEVSRPYLTEDYYATLEVMIARPDSTPVLHEWEFWFVSSDGTPIAKDACKVLRVKKIDDTHATAVIRVTPATAGYAPEGHILHMERCNGRWLLSDFDDTFSAAQKRLAPPH